MNTAIVGINWGDEGKGRMVDLLSENYQVVVRYQGGNNAGHTVVNDLGKFVLNLLPSGILRKNVVNVMGNGMVIDLEHLSKEIERLRGQGVEITPERLKISDKAVICMPYDVIQDCMEEERLKDRKYGSTKRGIAPVYGDKYLKKALKTGDLLYGEGLEEKVRGICEWKNIMLGGRADADLCMEWLKKYGEPLKPYICDSGEFLLDAAKQGENIMFEAQLGALRDIDFGIYPYTSSSNVLAAYAPVGSGAPSLKIDGVVGVVKAYSSCVGEGPFVSELFGTDGDSLREAGGEYGAATGRPRRVGAFDVIATKYGVEVQGATEIALTKADILTGTERIPVCVSYLYKGRRLTRFPYSAILDECKPELIYLDGWTEDISRCRTFGELPENCRKYIKFIESAIGCQISLVSVGAGREQYIKMNG